VSGIFVKYFVNISEKNIDILQFNVKQNENNECFVQFVQEVYYFSNLMNLGEIYIFSINRWCQGSAFLQHFDTLLTIKTIWHLDLSATFQMCQAICCYHKT